MSRDIKRNVPLRRRGNKYGAVRSVCIEGHHHASKLESAWCQALNMMQQGGQIRGLRQQVTHTLYLGSDPTPRLFPSIMGWCSCMGPKHARGPDGLERFRAIRPDFEFEELQGKFRDSDLSSPGEWVLTTADAKGAGQEAQTLAYRVFELIHGRPVRLYKRMP